MSDSSDIPDSNWTKEKLVWPHDAASLEAKKKEDPTLWGRPGYLTEDQADAFFKFKEVVESRGGDFKDTVYTFGIEEGEVYALTRWLRARKFVFDDVMKMVEEATKVMAEPKANNFYIDPSEALGCPQAVYDAQYPQVYSGFAKNGSPVFFSKVGVINVSAIECVTTIPNIVKYHWYVMMHDFGHRLRQTKEKDPKFKQFECVCIIDLANLTVGQLTSNTLALTKEQAAVDSLCFPETLYKMFIINSPRFFSATWTIIKGWLDPRTASKIEVLSSRKAWEKVLLDYIDVDQLPSDYGGTGPVTKDTMEKEGFTGSLKRLHTEVLSLRSSDSTTFDIYPGETLEVSAHTRSMTGAKFTVSDATNKAGTTFASEIPVVHHSAESAVLPSSVVLTKTKIKGPASIKVKAETMGSRFAASSSNYLVVFSVH